MPRWQLDLFRGQTIRPPGGAAWVSLDQGDNHPARFWDYFIAAIKKLQPAAGDSALSVLHSSQHYPAGSLLTAVINDLATLGDNWVLVLGDYHPIQAEPIHAGVILFVDHLPPSMHLVIATRVDPACRSGSFLVRVLQWNLAAVELKYGKLPTAIASILQAAALA